jgi:uridine kinase
MEKVMIIGIAGGSGSGKTTLARELQRRLGDRIVLLSHDAYYKRHDDLTMAEREQLNYDEPAALETELMVEHLTRLRRGEAVDCPVYDFTCHNRSNETVRIEPRRVILVEGILIFENQALRDQMDLRIFVDAEADVRLWRRIKRDVTKRGRTVESVLNQYRDTVRPMYLQYVEPTKQYASFILPHGGKDKAVQDMLEDHILKFLDSSGAEEENT